MPSNISKHFVSFALIAFVGGFIFLIYIFALFLSIFSRDKEKHFQSTLKFITDITFYKIGAVLSLKGLGNTPEKGPVLIVSNYQNYMDSMIIISAVNRKFYLTAGPTFFKFPFSLFSKPCGYI